MKIERFRTKVIYEKSISCFIYSYIVPLRKEVVEGNMEQRSGGESAIIQSWSVELRLTRRLFHRHRRFVERAEEAAHP